MSNFPKSGPFDFHEDVPENDDFGFDSPYAAASGPASPYLPHTEAASPETDELLRDVANSSSLSVVGATLAFNGELIADEDLLIQGRIHGTIEHNADNLTIGIHGKVRADIRARKILVQGEVNGNMYATERVIVESSARVNGDIFAPTVGLKEGAKFKGRIDMDGPPAASDGTANDSIEKKKSRRRPPKSSPGTADASKAVSDSVVDATLSENEAPEGAAE